MKNLYPSSIRVKSCFTVSVSFAQIKFSKPQNLTCASNYSDNSVIDATSISRFIEFKKGQFLTAENSNCTHEIVFTNHQHSTIDSIE